MTLVLPKRNMLDPYKARQLRPLPLRSPFSRGKRRAGEARPRERQPDFDCPATSSLDHGKWCPPVPLPGQRALAALRAAEGRARAGADRRERAARHHRGPHGPASLRDACPRPYRLVHLHYYVPQLLLPRGHGPGIFRQGTGSQNDW